MNIIVSTELTTLTCPHCAGVFAIAQSFMDEAKTKGDFAQCWTCPYCKQSRGYGRSQHEIEREQLKKQIAELERAKKLEHDRREYAEKEAEHFRNSRNAMKGVLAKERRRIGNGVCPCCHRMFKQLASHMKQRHPGYVANCQKRQEHEGNEKA